MTNLFDIKFVHFEWDDSLFGKTVFFADDLLNLKKHVNENILAMKRKVEKSNQPNYPFFSSYRYVYYDPNYEAKLAFFLNKPVQRFENGTWIIDNSPNFDSFKYEPSLLYYVVKIDKYFRLVTELEDLRSVYKGNRNDCIDFIKNHYCKYCLFSHQCRLDKEGNCTGFLQILNRMTNKELSEWLAKGNGQVGKKENDVIIWKSNAYQYAMADKDPVPKEYFIRGWDDPDWHEPLI